MKFNLVHFNTCYPSSWAGHHFPYVSVFLDRGPLSIGDALQKVEEDVEDDFVMGHFSPEVEDDQEFNQLLRESVEQAREDNAHRLDTHLTPKAVQAKTEEDWGELRAYFVFVPEDAKEWEQFQERIENTQTFLVCSDCLMWLINGDSTGLDYILGEEESWERLEEIKAGERELLEASASPLAVGGDVGFHATPCECCGDWHHGDRTEIKSLAK